MTMTQQTIPQKAIQITFKHSLTKYQREAMFHPARYVIIAASTKSGKTHSALVWLLCKACERSAIYWWISPVYTQAKIAYTRMKRGLMQAGGANIGITCNDSDMTIKLPNGSSIWFRGSDNSDSLYGEDVAAAVIDEASRCKEQAYHAVRSTLTKTKGPVRMIGNCTGKTNWFYRLGELVFS
ncbi:MAG: phage terminase large subunit [Armatimonadota bacterium]